MPAHGFGLVAAQLTGKVWSQQWDRLLMGELGRPLGGQVFLLEPEAGSIEQRLDGAFGHLQSSSDLAIAEVLKLAEREDEGRLAMNSSSSSLDPSALRSRWRRRSSSKQRLRATVCTQPPKLKESSTRSIIRSAFMNVSWAMSSASSASPSLRRTRR